MKKATRILAALMAAMLVLLMLPTAVIAADEYEISEFDYGYRGPKDTPLLVILVNYDPSLNGEDFEDGEMLLQWNDHSYWSEMFFGNGPKTLKTYFETQSGGNFRFTPATENFADSAKKNAANDGVVEVTIAKSLPASYSSASSSNYRYNALEAAVKGGYVDFSVYDKDGNKFVDETELMLAIVSAGFEKTRSSQTPNFNAHKSSVNYSFNGVKVATNYAWCGEMINGSTPITVGSFCHELGHALGNGDLYVTAGSWGGANSPAGKVSVMAGNGSSGANDGENKGQSPSNFDPYHLTVYGLYDYTNVGNGEYTLYSRQSKKGTYNILKISTPDPMEYYLVENRYFDNSSEHFDSQTNYDGTRGIVIWHVDQGIADSGRAMEGMTINTPSKNGEIGVAALAPATVEAPRNPASSGVFNKAGLVFDCHAYAFPGSGTWYTRMSDEQAALFDLHIEILDNPGHEMKIKVTGVHEVVSPRLTFDQDVTINSITCRGQVYDLNNQVLTSMRFEASETEDFATIAATASAKPDAQGNYSATLTGLKDATYYYTRVVLGTKNGEFDTVKRVKTSVIAQENTTEYNINFYRNLTEGGKAYGQKAKVNEPIVVQFPMKKTGQVFLGWYTDEACTEYFEISNGKADYQDIDLYARWTAQSNAAKLTVKGATLINDKVNPAGYAAIGETFREPVIAEQAGKEFVGWYADAAFTQPFDFEAVVESNAEVFIYAKWKTAGAEEMTTVNPAVTETTTGEGAPAVTTNEGDPATTDPVDKDGSSSGLIVVIVIVALVLVAGVAIVFLNKKKKK